MATQDAPEQSPRAENRLNMKPAAQGTAAADATSAAGAASQAAPVTAPAPHMDRKHVVMVFAGLLLAMFVSSLSETIAATALPTIVGDLGGVEIMQWVPTAYILTSTITMPIYGRLGDLMGRKWLLVTGLVVYAAGKVVCGLSVNMGMLIAGRCISGLGGGGLIILSQAAVADLVPARQRGTYLGVMGSVFTVSNVLGPLLGGWFVEVTGWRGIFWFTVPMAIAAAVALTFLMKEPRKPARPTIDYAGMMSLAVAVTSFVLTIAWGGDTFAWDSWQIIALAVACILAITLFIHSEQRAAEPIIPMMLFRNQNFVICSLAGMLINASFVGTINYLPTYLQIVDKLSPEAAGLACVPMSIGVFVTSTLSGWVASKTGKYKGMILGMCAVSAAGFLMMSMLPVGGPLWTVLGSTFVLGVGLGLGLQLLVLVVQNEFPHAIVGTATAANNFFRQIGSTVGTSLIGSLFTMRLTTGLAGKIPASAHVSLATLTPSVVSSLPAGVQEIIAQGYSHALLPLFAWFVPLMAAAFMLLAFIKRHPLSNKIDNLGEGRTRV